MRLYFLFLFLSCSDFLNSTGLRYLTLCDVPLKPSYNVYSKKHSFDFIVNQICMSRQASQRIKNTFLKIKIEFKANISAEMKKKIIVAFVARELVDEKKALVEIILKICEKLTQDQARKVKRDFSFLSN